MFPTFVGRPELKVGMVDISVGIFFIEDMLVGIVEKKIEMEDRFVVVVKNLVGIIGSLAGIA
jgi:hypothetical protein